MDLTSLVDLDAKDPNSVIEFIDQNDRVHQTVFLAFMEAGVVIQRQPLSPYDLGNPDWLRLNFAEHQRWSLELNLPLPQGLDEADFHDPKQVEDFVRNHADHHALVASALGL